VVNVSLPAIERDLGANGTALQWIVAGYPLAYAVGLILGARLGDRHGRRRIFVAGLALFGAFSLACGLAADPAQLVAFRLAQGVAAALMVPQVLTSIQTMYAPHERGAAMGLFTAVIGIAAVAGPITGALLTDADLFGLGWRPIFLINVPIAMVAVVAAHILIPESRADRPAPITVRSSLLLGTAMAAFMLPITLGPDLDWPWWGFVLMLLGAGLTVTFVRGQIVQERRGRVPMVPPALFADRGFARGLLAYALLSIPTGGFFLIHSIHVQQMLGWSVLRTGLCYVPFSVATSVAAGIAATKLAGRFGPRVLQAGAAVFALGLMSMVLAERSAHPALLLVPALTLAGVGFGVIVGAAGLLILHRVDVAHAGAASGVFNTTQALSVAVGAAVFGSVYAGRIGAGPHSAYAAAMLSMVILLAAGAVLAGTMPRAGRPRATDTGSAQRGGVSQAMPSRSPSRPGR
jgi:MFS family permease